jgi:hypothetical protein
MDHLLRTKAAEAQRVDYKLEEGCGYAELAAQPSLC